MPGEPYVRVDSHREGTARRLERRIAALVERQHGVVSRAQLREYGMGDGAIDARLARRRLLPVHRGVYAVGHRRLAPRGRWVAGLLAAGPGAFLSHRSAAALWELCRDRGDIHVTVRGRRRRQSSLRIHETDLAADETCVHDEIPVTTVARTLFDLASLLPREQLEQAISRAESRMLADAPSLPALVARYPGHRGLANLRAILADGRIGLDVTRSELEVRFLTFLRERGLPRPEANVIVDAGGRRVEVDCLWRRARLVAELDGHCYHVDLRAFETDRRRDRALLAAGYRCMRITWRALELESDALETELRAALGRPVARLP
jgi:Protein of unknown function (DUF559)